MMLAHIKLLVKRFYKRPASKVVPGDRRLLVVMLMTFFGIRRFGDIQELQVEDLTEIEGGDLEVYVKRSKTDQEGRGFIFHLSGARVNGFSITGVVRWYIKSLGLSGEDFLFPRFRHSGGQVLAQVSRPVSYSTVAEQLKAWCRRECIPDLTLHAGRRGGCTLAVEVGLDKLSIQKIGNWSSNVVEDYFQPRRAGIGFTRRAVRSM